MGDVFKPSVESRQPKSQASPLGDDILTFLQQAMEGGDFGKGLSPDTKAASGNISEFINNRMNLEMFNELLGPLRKGFERDTQRGEASIKESMGATGNRFSTSTQKNIGNFRGERANALDTLISNLFLNEQGNLLSAIGAQQAFGQQNMQPFFDFGALGILPEQTIVGDSPFSQVIDPIAQGAAAYYGAKG